VGLEGCSEGGLSRCTFAGNSYNAFGCMLYLLAVRFMCIGLVQCGRPVCSMRHVLQVVPVFHQALVVTECQQQPTAGVVVLAVTVYQ
jgi:hypothetical protein